MSLLRGGLRRRGGHLRSPTSCAPTPAVRERRRRPGEVPLYLLSKAIRAQSTVAWWGESADEIFSGYAPDPDGTDSAGSQGSDEHGRRVGGAGAVLRPPAGRVCP